MGTRAAKRLLASVLVFVEMHACMASIEELLRGKFSASPQMKVTSLFLLFATFSIPFDMSSPMTVLHIYFSSEDKACMLR